MSNGYQSPVNQPGNIITGAITGPAESMTETRLESELFTSESRKGEGARAVEDERKLWWSVGLGLLGSLFGPIGTIAGAGIGKIIGELSTVGGKQAESYLVTTEEGKYGAGQGIMLEDFNRNLQTYDKGQLWTDVMDIGKLAMATYQMTGAKSFKEFSPFSWDAKENIPAWGAEKLGLDDAWKRLFPNR
tara:strand:+ start:981 stop:1547 length:567 start_codon:yes stop_codon:yes gene_type:complete